MTTEGRIEYDVPLAQALHDIGAGRRQWPVSTAKRHHFIPRFMLAPFVDQSDGRLFQMPAKRGAPRKVKPEEAASRRRFYAVATDESPVDNRLESMFGLIEDHAAPAFKRFLDAPSPLGDSDHLTLALFLTLYEHRTPGGLERWLRFVEDFEHLHMQRVLYDRSEFAAIWRQSNPDASSEDVEWWRRETVKLYENGNLQLRDARALALGLLVDQWLDMTENILTMRWTMLRAGEDEFILNDRGLAMVDPTPVGGAGSAWRSSPNAETTIPLAPDSCLLLTPHRPSGIREFTLDGKSVAETNVRAYGWADEHLFGASQHALSETRRLARDDPQRVPRPRPLAGPRPRIPASTTSQT